MLTEPAIPEDVQSFLHDHLQAHEHLEVLLWVRTHADQAWTAQSIALELRMSELLSEEALRALYRRRLVRARKGFHELLFQYGPHTVELDQLVGKLARAYDEGRVAILKLMTANALQRLRTKTFRRFCHPLFSGRTKRNAG